MTKFDLFLFGGGEADLLAEDGDVLAEDGDSLPGDGDVLAEEEEGEKFFLEKNLSSLKQLVEDLEEIWGARNTCLQEGYACSSALEKTSLTEL